MTRGRVFLAGVLFGALLLGLMVLGWKTQVTVVPTVPDAVGARPAGIVEPEPAQALPVPVAPAPEEPVVDLPQAPVSVVPPPQPLPESLPEPLPQPVTLPRPPPGELPPAAGAPDADAMPRLSLIIPVEGITAVQLSDTFTDARGTGRLHDAIDIMAPTGTPVRAVADGRIVKLFNSEAGGLTIYQFDGDETVAFYYAHLDRYAEGVAEGQEVKQGDLIGYVGYTGNASPEGPHLHFAIMVLGPEKNWWQGTAINPYPYLRR